MPIRQKIKSIEKDKKETTKTYKIKSMEKKISVLQGGSVYFFYRPKVENSPNQKEEVQRFFFVLQPQSQNKYQLLIVGKKQLPVTEKNNYFLFLEAIKNNKENLLSALNEQH